MADCSANPLTWGDCASNVVGDAVVNGVTEFAKSMMDGYDQLLKTFITSWLGQGVLVDLSGPSVAWFQTSISFLNVFLITIGLMIAAIRTAFASKGEPMTTAFKALGTVLFISFAGTLSIQVLLVAGNAFSKWILESAGLSATEFVVMVSLYISAPGLAIILGLFGILATGIQWGIMFMRGAILPLLNAFWPTAASMAMFKGHEGAFQKLTTWILAFIIYSPLAACIYAFAWRVKSGDDGVGGVINGLILIILAVMALPALLRLMAPISESMGRAAGGAMAMGMTAAAVSAGVAVGAAVASGGGSAAASGGGASTAAKTSAPTADAGVAKGGGATPDGGGSSKEATGSGGDSGGGSDAAGSAIGGDGPTAGGQASEGSSASGDDSGGGSPAASGGESSGSSSGTPAASGGGSSGGSGAGWKAAQAATDSASNNSGDNTAEGMISE